MYKDGQKISKEEYTRAAMWCNRNNHYIEKKGNDYYIKQFPQQSIEEVKETKIYELKSERDAREEAPVEYKGKLWDFDTKSRDRINAAATALEVSGVESITWTSYDDSSLELSVIDLKSIVATAAIRGDYLHKRYRELRDLVNSATTIEEVQLISWN
jgi:hypothetical protein